MKRGSDIIGQDGVTRDRVRQELVTIFRTDLFVSKDPIDDGDELIADLRLDSSNFAVALVVIEERLKAPLPVHDIISCRTFGDLVDLVQTCEGLT